MGYRIPCVRVTLVREGSIPSDTKQVRCAEDAYQILSSYLDGVDREHVVVMFLNTKHYVLGINTVSVGSLDASVVHPREVLKPAILANASAILIAHNHPSGDPEPSPEDISVTKILCEACKIIGIDLLDHLVLGEGRFISIRAQGYL
ncbi:JAB domain-containing protein [Alicyclobacillus kakegawensis]|uniref:JAB domain-containing protein n=1 Tax=Alicyclobacillus kakegawensis TaxID=392012 RepID=UPI00082A8378|nr:JAB domain-containing protein [Alicyclobacillus kakegawensis]